jgi:arylsulfatase A-like enzyme
MKTAKLLPGNTLIALIIMLGASSQLSLSQRKWNAPFVKVNKDAPNILWITTDQQRWNTIGALGNEYVKTPNIDRLVKEGVSFNKAHCNAPLCTPSRASFMTGMYPSNIQACKNGMAEWPETAPLVTKVLKDNGYECGLSGKLHLSTAMAHRPEKRPEDDGYQYYAYSHSPYQSGSANDYIKYYRDKGIDILALKKEKGYVPEEYHQTKWCVDRAIDFVKEKREWPWMFSLNIYDPHGPFDPPQKYIDRYDIKNMADPAFKKSDLKEKSVFNNIMFQSKPTEYSKEANRMRLIKYWAQIDLIDEQIGRLLKVLETTGQLNNTMIIFTSDHGDMAGDHGLLQKGCRFYEGLVRVPLIFYYPGKFKQNLQSDALVELIDIVPSLYELVGLPVGKELQGKSLLPILKGEKPADHHKDFVRCEFYDGAQSRKSQMTSFANMYRTQQYKLITYHGHEKGELFNLEKDPNEFHNLWDDPKYKDIRFELIKKSFDAAIRTSDTGPERIGRY